MSGALRALLYNVAPAAVPYHYHARAAVSLLKVAANVPKRELAALWAASWHKETFHPSRFHEHADARLLFGPPFGAVHGKLAVHAGYLTRSPAAQIQICIRI